MPSAPRPSDCGIGPASAGDVPQGLHRGAAPLEDGVADCVISNGVINLCAGQDRGVPARRHACSRPGGRLAIADIVTEKPLPETVVCNATLWAACIGGAAQEDRYREQIEAAGLRVERVQENPAYRLHLAEREERRDK